MIKRYDLINVPCHGGWDSYDELQEVEDGAWVRYEDHAAEVERLSTEGLHRVALSIATSNALPDILAELRTLRARVAELEEDRQAERDRILGARVREIASQHDAHLDPYGFAREVAKAMDEVDKEFRDA